MSKITFDFDKLAKGTLNTIGVILRKQAKQNMNKVSFGRVYIIGGKPHIASKSGDTANNLSGALNKSIRFKVSGKVLEFGAGNEKVDYAKYLENGTSKMNSRPNYTKSLLQNEKLINAKVKKLFKQGLGFK